MVYCMSYYCQCCVHHLIFQRHYISETLPLPSSGKRVGHHALSWAYREPFWITGQGMSLKCPLTYCVNSFCRNEHRHFLPSFSPTERNRSNFWKIVFCIRYKMVDQFQTHSNPKPSVMFTLLKNALITNNHQ